MIHYYHNLYKYLTNKTINRKENKTKTFLILRNSFELGNLINDIMPKKNDFKIINKLYWNFIKKNKKILKKDYGLASQVSRI